MRDARMRKGSGTGTGTGREGTRGLEDSPVIVRISAKAGVPASASAKYVK